MATLESLEILVYDILREDQNSSAYPLSFVDSLLNSAQNRICSGTVINPFNGQAVRKGSLSFLDSSRFYSNVNLTTLTADLSIGGSTIDVADTSYYPESGSLYINGNIVTYTGRGSNQFTGVSGIDFAHLAGAEVSIIFSLPIDYSSMTNITYANSFKLKQKNYDDIWEDLNSNKGYSHCVDTQIYKSRSTIDPFYTIIGDYFLIFNRNNNGDQIHIRYERKPTMMTTSTSPTTIPDEYSSVIAYLAVGELLYSRGEEARAGEIINFALGQVRELYTHYNERSHESLNGVAYKIGKSRLNI